MELVFLLEDVIRWWCDPWNFLSGIMSIIALCGTFLNAERKSVGFLFWLVSNLYMTIRFFVIEEYAQMVLFFIYFLLAIKGIAVWERKDKQQLENERAAKRVRQYIENHYRSKLET